MIATLGASRRISVGKIASEEDRSTEDVEIIRPHGVTAHGGRNISARTRSVNIGVHVVAPPRSNAVFHQGSRFHAGQSAEPVHERSVEVQDLCIGAQLLGRSDAENEQPLRAQPKVYRFQISQRVEE